MRLKLREPMSGLTHFVGIIFAIVGLVILLTRQTNPLTVAYLISFSIFGGAMILLYTFSTLYHWLPLSEKGLRVLRKIDHIMIFVFIAATYTPVCLLVLPGPWGYSILASVWGLTLLGLFSKIFWIEAPRYLYTGTYLLMGWIIVIGIWPLLQVMDSGGLFWMSLGGLFYTIGAVIYAFKKPDPWPRVVGFHEIFHGFVLLGSFSHFWLMYQYV